MGAGGWGGGYRRTITSITRGSLMPMPSDLGSLCRRCSVAMNIGSFKYVENLGWPAKRPHMSGPKGFPALGGNAVPTAAPTGDCTHTPRARSQHDTPHGHASHSPKCHCWSDTLTVEPWCGWQHRQGRRGLAIGRVFPDPNNSSFSWHPPRDVPGCRGGMGGGADRAFFTSSNASTRAALPGSTFRPSSYTVVASARRPSLNSAAPLRPKPLDQSGFNATHFSASASAAAASSFDRYAAELQDRARARQRNDGDSERRRRRQRVNKTFPKQARQVYATAAVGVCTAAAHRQRTRGNTHRLLKKMWSVASSSMACNNAAGGKVNPTRGHSSRTLTEPDVATLANAATVTTHLCVRLDRLVVVLG